MSDRPTTTTTMTSLQHYQSPEKKRKSEQSTVSTTSPATTTGDVDTDTLQQQRPQKHARIELEEEEKKHISSNRHVDTEMKEFKCNGEDDDIEMKDWSPTTSAIPAASKSGPQQQPLFDECDYFNIGWTSSTSTHTSASATATPTSISTSTSSSVLLYRDVLRHIFSYMPFYELPFCSRVSRLWHEGGLSPIATSDVVTIRMRDIEPLCTSPLRRHVRHLHVASLMYGAVDYNEYEPTHFDLDQIESQWNNMILPSFNSIAEHLTQLRKFSFLLPLFDGKLALSNDALRLPSNLRVLEMILPPFSKLVATLYAFHGRYWNQLQFLLQMIARDCTHLTELIIDFFDQQAGTSPPPPTDLLDVLPQMKNLTSLVWRRCFYPWGREHILSMRRITQLRHLYLCENQPNELYQQQLDWLVHGDGTCSNSDPMPPLESIGDTVNYNLSDELATLYVSIPTLTSFSFRPQSVAYFTDLSFLLQFPHLIHLDVSFWMDMYMSGGLPLILASYQVQYEIMSQLTRLRTLKLACTPILDHELTIVLLNMKSLESLTLQHMYQLDTLSAFVCPEVLKHAAHQLHTLILNECTFSYEAVQNLTHLRSLRHLHLLRCWHNYRHFIPQLFAPFQLHVFSEQYDEVFRNPLTPTRAACPTLHQFPELIDFRCSFKPDYPDMNAEPPISGHVQKQHKRVSDDDESNHGLEEYLSDAEWELEWGYEYLEDYLAAEELDMQYLIIYREEEAHYSWENQRSERGCPPDQDEELFKLMNDIENIDENEYENDEQALLDALEEEELYRRHDWDDCFDRTNIFDEATLLRHPAEQQFEDDLELEEEKSAQ